MISFTFQAYFMMNVRGEWTSWKLPPMNSVLHIANLNALAEEADLYNKWIRILDAGHAPVTSYDSPNIQQNRFKRDTFFLDSDEKNVTGMHVLDVCFRILIDDKKLKSAQKHILCRSIKKKVLMFQSTMELDLEKTDAAKTESHISVILENTLGPDPNWITLGYTMFPVTRKLVHEPYDKLYGEMTEAILKEGGCIIAPIDEKRHINGGLKVKPSFQDDVTFSSRCQQAMAGLRKSNEVLDRDSAAYMPESLDE